LSGIDWNDTWSARFKAAMDEDFGTPDAVAVLFELANEVNRTRDSRLAGSLKSLSGILGLLQEEPTVFLQRRAGSVAGPDDKAVDEMIAARAAAKAAKNFAEADRIRNQLKEAGILLEDGPQGTIWRRA
jgi:cysteinyl-tRNA synthetase